MLLRKVVGWPLYLLAYPLFIVLFVGVRLLALAYWVVAGPVAFLFLILYAVTRAGFFEAAHNGLIELFDLERLDYLSAEPVAWVDRLRGVEAL